MGISDKYKVKREAINSEKIKFATERANSAWARLKETEQFKLSALALPEAEMDVEAVIANTVIQTLDPKSDFLDTLRAKGFRIAEIHALVERLYKAHVVPLDADMSDLPEYENMLQDVADYVYTHQEIYNSLDPEALRTK